VHANLKAVLAHGAPLAGIRSSRKYKKFHRMIVWKSNRE
jgi:hypothetical protein